MGSIKYSPGQTCPKCSSSNIEYNREFTGWTSNSHQTWTKGRHLERKRNYVTTGFCKACGYTWVVDSELSQDSRKHANTKAFNSITDSKSNTSTYSNSNSSSDKSEEDRFYSFLIGILFIILIIWLISHLFTSCVSTIEKNRFTYTYTLNKENVVYVTNPSGEYIVGKLDKVDGINTIINEKWGEDRNKLLNDKNGGTAVVFFAHDRVRQGSTRSASDGGCIEVFKDDASANRRYVKLKLLGFLNGKVLKIGTVIIRTSNELSTYEQKKLINDICLKLLEG